MRPLDQWNHTQSRWRRKFKLIIHSERDDHIGNDWNLIWSDEFNGETLDETKWSRQIEKAGRFNEEWQHYTDKKDSPNRK